MKKYKQDSKRLRESDFLDILTPVNVRLENNYCRGFQQGLVFLLFAMKEMELENVSALDVYQASIIAGSMRLRKSHPRWYGDAFIDEFCKAHLRPET
jgi:hypothetical protein